MQHEGVDRIADPSAIANVGRLRCNGLAKSPVIAARLGNHRGGHLPDPRFNSCHFALRERFTERHSRLQLTFEQAGDEGALLGMAGNYRHTITAAACDDDPAVAIENPLVLVSEWQAAQLACRIGWTESREEVAPSGC